MSFSSRYRNYNVPGIPITWNPKHVVIDGVVSSTSPRTQSYNSEHGSMSDRVTTSYHKRRAAGEVIMNPMTLRKFTQGPPDVRTKITTDQWVDRVRGLRTMVTTYQTYHRPNVPSPILISYSKYLESITGAQARAQSSAAQALVTLGEFRKTIDLLVNVKKRWTERFVSLFHKTPRHKFKRLMDAGSSTWLEARYGWRPLHYEAQDYVEAFTRKRDSQTFYRSSFTTTEEDVVSSNVSVANGPISGTYIVETKIRRSCTTVLIYQLNPNLVNGMDDKFGISNFLSTAWELVPFSFVADWFTNIGDYIASLENQDLVVYKGGCVTRRTYNETKSYWEYPSVSAEGSALWVERTPVTSGMPRGPVVSVSLNFPKLVDLFFLGRQILKR